MLRLNSNNQIVLLYYYDNKKQPTIVLYLCHLNATVNHLRSTSTYTSYFILLLFVTKYYKSAEYVGGDSVMSDQTFILSKNAKKRLFSSSLVDIKLTKQNFFLQRVI